MKRTILHILLVVAFVATLSGCAKRRNRQEPIPEVPQQSVPQQRPAITPPPSAATSKVAILSFDGITGSLSDGLRVLLTVRNDSAAKITLSQARLVAHATSSEIATATLIEPVELARHTTAQVSLPMRLTLHNPLYAAILLGSIRGGATPDISVSLEAEVSALGAKRKIAIDRMPLADILKKLNIR